MPHGMLDVYVEGAVAVKDSAVLGKGSPYCNLTVGSQAFSSPPVKEGGTHPYFNTKFEFNIDRSAQQLDIAIYSKKTLSDDDLLGYCTIIFKDVFYHGYVVPVTPYALTRPSGRPGGHIRLSLTFEHREPRPPAPAPQPRAVPGPYRQPRPLGPPAPSSYPQQPGPPPVGPYRQPRRPPAGPPQQPQYEPRRMYEESELSSASSDSDGEDKVPPGPYQPQPHMQYAPRGRGRAGPPPGRAGLRPRQPGLVRGPAPPPQAGNNNVMRNSAAQVVTAAVVSDGDGSDWGGGEDVSVDGSFGHESYGSTLEDGYHENSGAVVEVESNVSYEERDVIYGESRDAAGAPAVGFPAVGYAPIAPGARGRTGPPRGGPLAGPPGRGPMRGRGPMARGGPPPMRGRGPSPPPPPY